MRTMLITVAFLLGGVIAASATLNVSSDGSDGALNVTTANKVIDLRLATTGTWNQNNAANTGNGVYDRDKRAVVFKFSSVNIAAGRTVTFINHPTRVPVVWLVSGNVVIAGTLVLDGGSNSAGVIYGEPGPGGFRGGPGTWNSVGLGIGGGANANGKFVLAPYGNLTSVPLVGGSGGSGGNNSGGGGGGAILIAAGDTMTVNGRISADSSNYNSGLGSSGAIRLVADHLTGTGVLSAYIDGRIRLEANTVTGSFFTNPQTAPVLPTVPPTLWPSDTHPTVKIVSIDGVSAPLYATGANMDVQADVDITKAANQPSTIALRTRNFPTNGTVKVRAAGKYSSTAILSPAATFVGTDQLGDNWQVSVTLPEGFTCLQAIATHTPSP
jgi:plastocyanin